KQIKAESSGQGARESRTEIPIRLARVWIENARVGIFLGSLDPMNVGADVTERKRGKRPERPPPCNEGQWQCQREPACDVRQVLRARPPEPPCHRQADERDEQQNPEVEFDACRDQREQLSQRGGCRRANDE